MDKTVDRQTGATPKAVVDVPRTLSETLFGAEGGKVVPELGEYFIANKGAMGDASEDDMNRLLTAIKLAAKVVHREISKAGLADILGAAGAENVQGEQQQKLDVFANNKFIQALCNREVVCGICSEEDDDFIPVNPNSKFVLLMDPLDGSSNIDVNVSVGTIFSIFKRVTPVGTPVKLEDFLQKGNKQLCAGYVLYGSSTMLVCTWGQGVHGFTLDPSLGTFYLSHPHLSFPKAPAGAPPAGRVYSVNEGNWKAFPEGIKRFIEWGQEESEQENRPYTLRYIGSLVSDFHRNLLQGGIYLYPPTKKDPNGKLRLLYECNPMAFIAEQAGGLASDGFQRIMDVQPTQLHQRVPIFTGSAHMVEHAKSFMGKYSPEYDSTKPKA
eukprot:GDKI01041597.1.p1 GENE.GDKI01041597.1~~GDKI01041597.1.p1  ORF type:complete len:396 (+),score=145.60 GDKI01041597.1:45-1190(+)